MTESFHSHNISDSPEDPGKIRAPEIFEGTQVLPAFIREILEATAVRMITDLVQIKRFGEKKRDENFRFRAWMKSHNYVERRFKAIAQAIEDAIDCTACANCCRVATTGVTERDIAKLARGLGMPEAELIRDYTVADPEEGRILKRNENGCVFLEGNLCGVYDFRPGTCQFFPHLVKGNGSLSSRMWQMADRAEYCPIVYNSLESFKLETGFKK